VLLNEGRFVDSDLVRRAQPVLLIGNPYGPEGSVFVGLISAKGRPANSDNPYGYFQIDANVSPSVAGGAVFDFDGNVIGMMQLIHTPANGAVPIGFALPSNIVREISQQIQGSGAVARGWLDVKLSLARS
jgi:S1-C subfamily serine protease